MSVHPIHFHELLLACESIFLPIYFSTPPSQPQPSPSPSPSPVFGHLQAPPTWHSLHYRQRHISKHKPDHVSSLLKTLQWLPMALRTWATLFLCPIRSGKLSLPSISCLRDQTLWSCQIAFPSVPQNGAQVLDTQSPLLWTFLVWPSPTHPLSFSLQLSSSGNPFCIFCSFPYSSLYTSSLKAFVMQYYWNRCVPAYMSHWNLGFLRAITMSL